jgi:hypothetical protein
MTEPFTNDPARGPDGFSRFVSPAVLRTNCFCELLERLNVYTPTSPRKLTERASQTEAYKHSILESAILSSSPEEDKHSIPLSQTMSIGCQIAELNAILNSRSMCQMDSISFKNFVMTTTLIHEQIEASGSSELSARF